MSLEIKGKLFEDKQNFSSLCLETSKTLSLGKFDEPKTHPSFKPIFLAYLRI